MANLPLTDGHNRVITHLRISLTEQCNFRCVYCMPPEGVSPLSQQNALTKDEIVKLVSVMSSMGITKVRLTGGEPLLRDDLVSIVRELAALPKLNDLALTTNGSHLASIAADLKKAGLKRINISLDSLNLDTFAKMARRESLTQTLLGIEAALKENFPVKINTVVMKGLNDHEMDDFIDFALTNPIEEWRFIEFMPLCGSGWQPQYVYSLQNVINKIKRDYQAKPIYSEIDNVAKSFLITKNGKQARLGFITTLSNPFCGNCSRIRLSADGVLRPCLFSSDGVALKALLARQATDGEIQAAIRCAVLKKDSGNEFYQAKIRGVEITQSRSFGEQEKRYAYPNIRSIGG